MSYPLYQFVTPTKKVEEVPGPEQPPVTRQLQKPPVPSPLKPQPRASQPQQQPQEQQEKQQQPQDDQQYQHYQYHQYLQEAQQQQQQQQPQQYIIMERNATPAHVPYPYGVRCGIYSILLVIGLAGIAFSVVSLMGKYVLQVYETYMYNATINYKSSRKLYVMALISSKKYSQYKMYTDSVDLMFEPSFYKSKAYLAPPAGVRAAGAASIVTAIFSGLLFIFACVMLGLLGNQRRRAQRYAAAEDEELMQLEALEQAQRAAASGQQVIIPGNPYAPQRLMAGGEGEAAQRDAQTAKDATVRQALAICCLVFAFICMAMSAVAVGGMFASIHNVKQGGERALNKANTTVLTLSYDNPLSTRTVWPTIPNLVLFFVATVLLCVPYLSGIADRPMPEDFGDDEYEEPAGAAPKDSVRNGLPLYTR